MRILPTITLLYTYAFNTQPIRPLRGPTRQNAAPDTDATANAYDALGITQVLEALTTRTATYRGAETFKQLDLANTVEDATRRYDEIRWLLKAERTHDETCIALANHSLATALTADLDALLDACEKATIPEVSDVALAADALRELDALYAWLSRRRLDGAEAAALSSMVAGSALALADEDAYRARLDCHPIRFALEETDDGTILSLSLIHI